MWRLLYYYKLPILSAPVLLGTFTNERDARRELRKMHNIASIHGNPSKIYRKQFTNWCNYRTQAAVYFVDYEPD